MIARELLCLCPMFEYWYTMDGPPEVRVCRCGHAQTEHLDRYGSCIGESIVGLLS